MKKTSSNLNLLVLFLLTVFTSQWAMAKKMYRWEDENGKVHFTDQVPPEKVKYGSKVLDEKARVLSVREGAKTKEEREAEQRMAILRKAQEKMIAKQQAHDKVLLATFRSVKDIELALESKKQTLAGQRRMLDGNLQRLQEQLGSQEKTAERFTASGGKVSEKLLGEIEGSKKQIQLAEQEIEKFNEKLAKLEREFSEDVERFLFLTKVDKSKEKVSPEGVEKNILGVFACTTQEQCDQAWSLARSYALTHATTKIDVDTDKLIMTRPVQTDTDLSLSISRMRIQDNLPEIFLDIRCHDSISGQELCGSEKVQAIRRGFKAFIKEGLARAE